MEHTPEPWNIGISADARPHFYFHVGPEQRLEWHIETYGNIPVTEADARLMAAAPELLEAAEEILDVSGYRLTQDRRPGTMLEKLLRAVVKAKGE